MLVAGAALADITIGVTLPLTGPAFGLGIPMNNQFKQNARAALEVADYGYVLEVGELGLHGPAADLARDLRVIDTYLGAARKSA